MAKLPNYKLTVHPGKKRNKNFLQAVKPKRKYRNLIVTVVGVYLIAGSILTFFIFNRSNPNRAQASEPALISGSVRFSKEKKFGLGEEIKILATFQNTSIVETISQVSVNLLSTKEAVRWEGAENLNTTNNQKIKIELGKLNLPDLSPGERAEYEISGTLKDATIDFLTILGKLNYNNSQGQQRTDTNRIYTQLISSTKTSQENLPLVLDKETYDPGEEVRVKLDLSSFVEILEMEPKETQINKEEGEDNQENTEPEENTNSEETSEPKEDQEEAQINETKDKVKEGKIYISNRENGKIANTFDCIFENTPVCEITISELPPGKYSALFISNKGNIFSKIQWFEIGTTNTSSNLIPSTQANMVTPFSSLSVNGKAPIIVDRVISKNESINGKNCIFEIYKENTKITEIKSNVDSNRSCRTILDINQLGNQQGIYRIKLANSDIQTQISFIPKAESLLQIQNQTVTPQKDQPLNILVDEIIGEDGGVISESTLSVNIYNHNTGQIEEISTLGGETLTVKDGQFKTEIPGNYFTSSGQYLLWVRLESGRVSDFINLVYSDTKVGFSQSGILVEDYSQLRVDRDSKFYINGITDRDGNQIAQGECTAEIYSIGDSLNPISLNGLIDQGKCEVILNKGKINKAGPILVTFAGINNSNAISQSRIFQLTSGDPDNYGEINFEIEPIRKKYANNLIIGPVTDSFGNLTDSFNLNLNFYDQDDNLINQFNDLNIQEGYLKIAIPATTLDNDSIKIRLKSGDQELISRDIETTVEFEGQKIILPNIPETLDPEKSLTVGISELDNNELEFCQVKFIKNKEQFLEESIPYSFEDKKCQLDWAVESFRDVPRVLLKFIVGDKIFTNVINLKPGEPANFFKIFPQVRFNSQNELEISLLTTPLIDRHGLPASTGEVRWEYNNKIENNNIKEGYASLKILAQKLESKDIQEQLGKTFLDLDLDVSASISAISRTNNIRIYLDNYDIANSSEEFRITQGSDYVTKNKPQIFSFFGWSCKALIISNSKVFREAITHWQGNDCYVQAEGDIGKNTLVFDNNGFEAGRFDYTMGTTEQYIEWCIDEDDSCNQIQVIAPTTSVIEAIIYDGQNQYKFSGDELSNTITISQNGLNPLKKYLVEVSYSNTEGDRIIHYKEILGERLQN